MLLAYLLLFFSRVNIFYLYSHLVFLAFQGVDLTNIVKEVMENIPGESKNKLISTLDKLGNEIKTPGKKK